MENNKFDFFSLKLSKYDNILNNISINEVYDINILNKLIHSDLLLENCTIPYTNNIISSEKIQLIKYRDLYNNGSSKIMLKRNEDYKFGRCNPVNGLSLFNIRKNIRHTLCKKLYVDIDIVNAHPTILYQICKNNNIKCDLLQKYVENRDYYIKLLTDAYGFNKEYIKTIFISIMYGANPKKIFQDIDKSKINLNYISKDKIIIIPILTQFKKEFDSIAKIICENNIDLVEYTKKSGKININGTVCSYFLQEKEVIILEYIFKYCLEKEYIQNNNCILCADGIMLMKKYITHINLSDILNELHDTILEKTNCSIYFVNKEMDMDFLEILDNHIIFDLPNYTFSSGLLADYFNMLYGNIFLQNNNKLYFYNGVYWEEDDNMRNKLHSFVDTVFYKKLLNDINKVISNLNNKITQLEKSIFDNELKILTTFLTSIQTLRKGKMRTEIVNDICMKITNNKIIFDDNPFLFAFNNTIYDLKECKFISPCSDFYIKTTTGYNYYAIDYNKKEKYLMNILNQIIPDDDTLDFYLTALSTGLSGLQIEKIFISSGPGGNAKSWINSLMYKLVGNYGYKLPSSVLLNEIKSGANPEIACMHNKRYILCQEPNDKKKINASTLKEITGDKTINARKNYSNDCVVNLSLSLFLECNNLPHIDEINDAIIRRIVVIPFNSKFVSREIYDCTEDKNNLYIADPNLKTDEFQHSHKCALFNILIEKWKFFKANNYVLSKTSNIINNAGLSYLAVSDEIFEWFKNYYEEDDSSYIIINDIYTLFLSSELWNCLNKIEKRKYTRSYFYNMIENNIFLKKYYKSPKKYKINDKYNTSPIIIRWKIINN